MDTNLIEENSGSGMEELISHLYAYFNTPKPGSPECKSLCEWIDSNGKKVDTSSVSSAPQKVSAIKPLNTVYYEGGGVAKKVREKAQRVVVTNKVTEIPANTFYDCGELQEVVLPGSITRIGNFAFSLCYNLTKINLPSSISYIAPEAFYKCDNLTINCEQGSIAEQYAKDHNIPVVYINGAASFAEEFEEYENLWD